MMDGFDDDGGGGSNIIYAPYFICCELKTIASNGAHFFRFVIMQVFSPFFVSRKQGLLDQNSYSLASNTPCLDLCLTYKQPD